MYLIDSYVNLCINNISTSFWKTGKLELTMKQTIKLNLTRTVFRRTLKTILIPNIPVNVRPV